MTYFATLGSYSTCCSKVSTETPSQWVSNLVHLVTQLMSTVGVSCGRASSSCQVQRFGSFTFPSIEKSQRSKGVCGVGPAESTGKPRSRYCPGGSRPATSFFGRRPRKAREMIPSINNQALNALSTANAAPSSETRRKALTNDSSIDLLSAACTSPLTLVGM